MQPFDVVDLRAVQVLKAERVDVEVDAVRLEAFVHVGRLVLEVKIVGEPGAPTPNHAKPETLALQSLGISDFFYFLGGFLGDGYHRGCPLARMRALTEL